MMLNKRGDESWKTFSIMPSQSAFCAKNMEQSVELASAGLSLMEKKLKIFLKIKKIMSKIKKFLTNYENYELNKIIEIHERSQPGSGRSKLRGFRRFRCLQPTNHPNGLLMMLTKEMKNRKWNCMFEQ